jgi:hypothetical protein
MITKGEIVLYTLSADDAEKINRRRTDRASIAERMKITVKGIGQGSEMAKGDPEVHALRGWGGDGENAWGRDDGE